MASRPAIEAARLLQAGQVTAAATLCREIVVAQPDDSDAWNVLGFAAATSGNPGLALTFFHRAAWLTPEVAGFRFNCGVARLGLGQLATAITDLQQSLRLEPDMADCLAYLALAYVQKGDEDTALFYLAQAVRLQSRAWDPLLQAATLLQQQSSTEARIEVLEAAYRRVLELNSVNTDAQINLGLSLRRRGALAEAAQLYMHILTSAPERIEAYCNMASVLFDLGRSTDAIALCQRAIALWPNQPEVYNTLGYILHHDGRLEEAAYCYQRALSISPNYQQVEINFNILIQDYGGISPVIIQNMRDVISNEQMGNSQKFQILSTIVFSCLTDQLRGEFLRTHEPHVQSGPFAGMRYHRQGVEGCYMPKIFGTYESALHEFIETAIARQPKVVLNIGSADGYYAVGLALRLPEAQIFAHDTDLRTHRMARILAERNGVGARLTLGGEFHIGDFHRFAQQRSLLICDIEGGEFTLLDPRQSPALATMDLIVELHEPEQSPRVQEFLARFALTHQITLRDSDTRILALPEFLRNRSQNEQMMGLWEARPGPTPWAIMWAREDRRFSLPAPLP